MKLLTLKNNYNKQKHVQKINFNRFYDHYHIGGISSFNDILSVSSLLSNSNTNIFFEHNVKEINNFDLGHSFLGIKNFSELEKYSAFFFFGFEPRFEASLLNICLARLKENRNVDYISYGSAFENFFFSYHKGAQIKNLVSLSEGRFEKLFDYRFIKRTRIFYGLEFQSIIPYTNNLMTFLEKKFYTNSSFLTNKMALINFVELLGGTKFQCLYAESPTNVTWDSSNRLTGWFFNTEICKMPFKKTKASYFDIFEVGIHSDDSYTEFNRGKGLRLNIPTTSFFEENNLVLSIFGKLDESDKASSLYKSGLFSTSVWLSHFFFLVFELQYLFWNWWVYNLENLGPKVNKNQLALGMFDEYGDLKNEELALKLNSYFSLFSLYSVNTGRFLHQYKKPFLSLEKNNQWLINGLSYPEVLNFYTTSNLLRYSPTMLNLSYIYSTHLRLK